MTKATKERFDAMARIGCIVCRVFHNERTDAHIHHLSGIKYRGMGMKADDEHTIPLCPTHHQYGSRFYPSVHGQPKIFAERYGTQEELLEMTNKLIEAAR
jgi:hypothetical protein